MYPVSDAYKRAIRKNERNTKIIGNITLSDSTVIDIDDTENDIIQDGSLRINRESMNNDIGVGFVTASELDMTLTTFPDNPYTLNGANVNLNFGIETETLSAPKTFDGTKTSLGTGFINNSDILLTKVSGLTATTLITNGDFSGGATGWNVGNTNYGTITASNNTLSLTLTGNFAYHYVYQTISGGISADKTYYVRYRVRVTNDKCTILRAAINTSPVTYFIEKSTPTENQWYEFSAIVSGYSATQIRLFHWYADPGTAAGKVMEVQYVSMVDLTSTFGAGNEPEKEYMDNLFEQLPNNYLNDSLSVENPVIQTLTENNIVGSELTISETLRSNGETKDTVEHIDGRWRLIQRIDESDGTVLPSPTERNADVTGGLTAFTDGFIQAQGFILPAIEYRLVEGVAWEYVPLGSYYITEVNRQQGAVAVKALDGLILFDVDPPSAFYLGTPKAWIQACCNEVGVTLATTDFSVFPNYSTPLFKPSEEVTEIKTCRDILMWVCQLLGANASMNRLNQLEIKPIMSNSVVDKTVTLDETFTQDVSDFAVNVSKVKMEYDGVSYSAAAIGADGEKTLTLDSNPFLFNQTIGTFLNNLINHINTFEYIPYEINVMGDPAVDAGDTITLYDTPNGDITTAVTHSSWQYRSYHKIKAAGEGNELIGVYSQSKKSVSAVEGKLKETADIASAANNTAQLLNNAIGGNIWIREETGGTGKNEILIMDSVDPLSAKKLWRWNIGGFGYSDNVTGVDNPARTYKAAMTMDGVIDADFMRTGTLMSQNGASWIDLNDGSFSFGNNSLTYSSANGLDLKSALYVRSGYLSFENIFQYPPQRCEIHGVWESGSIGTSYGSEMVWIADNTFDYPSPIGMREYAGIRGHIDYGGEQSTFFMPLKIWGDAGVNLISENNAIRILAKYGINFTSGQHFIGAHFFHNEQFKYVATSHSFRGTIGNVLQITTDKFANHCYLSFYPRSASLGTMGGVVGFNSAGKDTFTIANLLGDIILNPLDGYYTTTRSIRPIKDNTYDLGTSSRKWRYVYSNNALQTSDIRFKINIQDVDKTQLEKFVDNINVVNFNYKDDTDRRIGVIANQLLDIDKDFADLFVLADDNGYLSLRATDLIFPLISYCQSLKQRIETLENKLN